MDLDSNYGSNIDCISIYSSLKWNTTTYFVYVRHNQSSRSTTLLSDQWVLSLFLVGSLEKGLPTIFAFPLINQNGSQVLQRLFHSTSWLYFILSIQSCKLYYCNSLGSLLAFNLLSCNSFSMLQPEMDFGRLINFC